MSGTDIINHDQAPQPHDKAKPLDKIVEFDHAIDYALAAFHVCVDKVEKGKDVEQWNESGWAYFASYTTMIGLRGLPGDHLPQCKELIVEADHKADVAAGRKKA